MQDSKLLVSGSISGTTNAITPQSNILGNGVTVNSDYSIDMLGTRDIGEGQAVYLKSVIAVVPTGGTSITVNAVVADDAGLTTNVTTIGTLGAIAVANMAAGQVIEALLPPQIGSLGRRYLGVQYVISGNITVAAQMITEFTLDLDDPKKFYPSKITVV